MFSSNRDAKYFPNPTAFDPNNFLDSSGKKVVKREAFIPLSTGQSHKINAKSRSCINISEFFTTGKRMCGGEILAKMEMFIFITSFIQNFTFSPPPGVQLTEELGVSFTRIPAPFKICAIPRE